MHICVCSLMDSVVFLVMMPLWCVNNSLRYDLGTHAIHHRTPHLSNYERESQCIHTCTNIYSAHVPVKINMPCVCLVGTPVSFHSLKSGTVKLSNNRHYEAPCLQKWNYL